MSSTKPKYRRTTKGRTTKSAGLAAKVAQVEQATLPKGLPEFKAGDTVRVSVRIKEGEKERVQAYEGLVIAKDNKGGSKSFNVRKMSHGVGVERIFLENSPKIAKLEVIQQGKVRRAKLYYIRELEGRAAKIDRDVETQAAAAASAAAHSAPASTAKK
jgi:large subunit ribosomal protein L19